MHEDAGTAEVVVDDDGAGIAAADRDRVFERFVRLDESRARDAGGSGLGLSIVREIVRVHGGIGRGRDLALGRRPVHGAPARRLRPDVGQGLPERAFRWLQGGFSDGVARWSRHPDTPPRRGTR